jgi:putative transposase
VNRYIDAHGEEFGFEPICSALQLAPSSYYAAKRRPPCRRRVHDEQLKPHIERVWRAHRCVYGPRKVYKQLRREGIVELRCRIERLMRELGLRGRVRGKKRRTTIPADLCPRPPDLVDRRFRASGPNQLWIADLTDVATWSGFAYAAFVTDVFSRRILGWRVSNTLRADLALDALEMAICARQGEDLTGLVHHSDRGVQPGSASTPNASPLSRPSPRWAPAVRHGPSRVMHSLLDGSLPVASDGLPYVLTGFSSSRQGVSHPGFLEAQHTGSPLETKTLDKPGKHRRELPLDRWVVDFG